MVPFKLGELGMTKVTLIKDSDEFTRSWIVDVPKCITLSVWALL